MLPQIKNLIFNVFKTKVKANSYFKTIDIRPHIGINEITFGLSSKQVHKILGHPNSTRPPSKFEYEDTQISQPKMDCYLNNCIQISYDENDTVEFIEIAPLNSNFDITINGINISNLSAHQTILKMEEDLNFHYNKNGIELPYTYEFLGQDLSFWRRVLPENTNDQDGLYFDTIAIGRKGYYSQK